MSLMMVYIAVIVVNSGVIDVLCTVWYTHMTRVQTVL